TITASLGSVSSDEITVSVKPPVTLESIAISPDPIILRVNQSLTLGVQGSYSDGSHQMLIDNVSYDIADETIASIDNGYMQALSEGTTTLQVSYGSLQKSVAVTVNEDINTSNIDFTSFGNSYTDLIPADATKTSYDEERFCMIGGQVFSEDGAPLAGVRVSLHNESEYGSVVTDVNGTYAIPYEGGGYTIVRLTKEGYTTIDRKIYTRVQDWNRAPDVTMLQIDTKVTTIDLNAPTSQIHISTPVTDDRGERSTTLVFDGVSKATVTYKDGTTKELESIDVRATEFKTPESMPSDLPQESAYTYCSDLKVDGVGDDANVTFDAPVIMYVDNFLDFQVGEIVPVGYYDRNQGKWIGSENGVVVELLDTDGDGKIDALDSTGDGEADDIDGDGLFEDEVAGIAEDTNYAAGKTYWRAAITHFTPWDHNWPWTLPDEKTFL
ncbi:MAG: carboxypeptidase-like regulatory domain-containing protein, partial [Sulfurovaceae bacterium]